MYPLIVSHLCSVFARPSRSPPVVRLSNRSSLPARLPLTSRPMRIRCSHCTWSFITLFWCPTMLVSSRKCPPPFCFVQFEPRVVKPPTITVALVVLKLSCYAVIVCYLLFRHSSWRFSPLCCDLTLGQFYHNLTASICFYQFD